MKRSEKLLDAIGQIDDRLVEEAAKAGNDPITNGMPAAAAEPVKLSIKERADGNEAERAEMDRRASQKKRKSSQIRKRAAIYRWQGALAACAVVAVCVGVFGLMNRNGLLLSPFDNGSTASGSAAMDAAAETSEAKSGLQTAQGTDASPDQNEAVAGQSADGIENAPEAFAAAAPEKQELVQDRSSAEEALAEEDGISAQSAEEDIMAQAENADDKLSAAPERCELPLAESEQKSVVSGQITAFVRESTAESVQLVIENGSEAKILFGVAYEVELLGADGSWQTLPLSAQGNIAWQDTEYVLNPQETWEETLFIGSFYGALSPGQYRIVKSYQTAGEEQEKTLYAEFTVSE